MMKCTLMLATALYAVSLGNSFAADHQVQMLNKGDKGNMVFQPDLITAAPGDTVTFVPTNAGHLAETIPGMVPEGVPPFKGAAGKPVTLTVDKEGVYGIKCLPHYSMGMVALIVVGKPANVATAKAVKQTSPLAQKHFDALFAQIPAN